MDIHIKFGTEPREAKSKLLGPLEKVRRELGRGRTGVGGFN